MRKNLSLLPSMLLRVRYTATLFFIVALVFSSFDVFAAPDSWELINGVCVAYRGGGGFIVGTYDVPRFVNNTTNVTYSWDSGAIHQGDLISARAENSATNCGDTTKLPKPAVGMPSVYVRLILENVSQTPIQQFTGARVKYLISGSAPPMGGLR